VRRTTAGSVESGAGVEGPGCYVELVLNRLDLRGVTGELASRLPRPDVTGDEPVDAVRSILAAVRAEGDAALRALTEQFDGVALGELRVPRAELDAALAATPPDLRAALVEARDAIEAFHRTQVRPPHRFERGGVVVEGRSVAVDRAGVYVPGGRGAYPSTVLMTAVPARVAGVSAVALCVPPDRTTGRVAPSVLAAAALAGVDELYAIGGAQAIGAMAFGTESVAPVDVIVGPGNAYVAIAKREVAGVAGIPSAFAGPSEVVVIADDTTTVEHAAIDVILQAEHGPNGLAWLITWSPEVADRVGDAIAKLVASSPRRADIESTFADGGYAVVVDGPEQALAVSNLIAPEHLELLCDDPQRLVPGIRHAGAVFCGPWSPASIGDYLAGPSHVLPTFGSARFGSALTVDDFVKQVHVVTVDRAGFERVAPFVERLADEEGFAAHADSIRLRLDTTTGVADARTTPPVVAPRDDVSLMAGYHSPQLDVDVRVNTNESPFPPPGGWLTEVEAAVRDVDWRRYPDRSAAALRAAIGRLHGVGPEHVFAANGSNEVLQTLLLTYGGPGRRAALWEPTYALHSHISRLTSTEVVTGERGEDFTLDRDEADRLLDAARPSVVFLCSPNNPTGLVEPEDLVRHVVARATDLGALVVVDEAYGQFAPWSALELVSDDTPIVVTRTYSKTWSMAAARLGYLVGPSWVVDELAKVVLPYHLDTFKQLAGTLAVHHTAEMDERVARLVEERGRLSARLQELPVDVWPSGANFVLFRPRDRDGADVWQQLVDRSVLVRNCADWPRLEGCLRVTVGTTEEDDRFLAALEEALR
jgi:histidinol-phosphate aminotransferase